MFDQVIEPFSFGLMARAIWVSALVGAVCGCLSCFITLKGWSLMGDALSHAIVPGVAVASLLNLPFTLGAFVAGMLASASITFVKAHTRLRSDAIIGIVLSAYFALGLFIMSLFPSGVCLKTIIYGNILAVSDGDLVQLLIIAVFTLLAILTKWKDLLLFLFDPSQARTIGLRVSLLHYLLLILLAVTCVAAMQTVGAILVVGMLVTPGAVAYLLTDRFHKMLMIATLFGLLSAFVGSYASYFMNTSTGGTIVVFQTVLFILIFLFAPRHGLIVSRLLVRAIANKNTIKDVQHPSSHAGVKQALP